MNKDDFRLPSMKLARLRRQDNVKNEKELFQIPEEALGIGEGKFYFIKTYGCQANVRDSETVSGILESLGFKETLNEEETDFLIFNTCAIRKNAEDRVFGEIGNAKRLKNHKPDMMFALCGCMAQEEEVVNYLLKTHKHVDLVFGTHNLHNLPKLLRNVVLDKKRVVEVFSKEGDVIENLPVKRFGSYKAWVNIMYGCDKFCTYCIVPYTRGKERSRTIEDILDEVIKLKEDGFKEVTLLGQNVNAYGKDLKLGYDFKELLEEVAKTGIDRIRFQTSHPWDFTFEMVDIIAKYPNIMPAIHLPVQSGNSEILRLMGRRYSIDKYKALYDKIVTTVPNASVTTDIIVGFPNETDEQFQDTLDLVDYCKYDAAFTFIYSAREGTPAAKMDDNINEKRKNERLQILNEKISYYGNLNNQRYKDRILKVLVDGTSKKNSKTFSGYSEENKLVNFQADNVKEGDIVKVKILECRSFSLNGIKVDEE